ncbi:hypothetical protein GI582_04800 [Sulfitobacter sp. BDSS02]|nr:hypothetical protein [Sulfitobacter sp. BDSS02]MBR9848365.1 hypothetical protein [Paracoccaceae bacterium]
MKRPQYVIGASVTAGALALATWAFAVPLGVSDLISPMLGENSGMLGANASVIATDPMMGDDVPEGTVLVFGEDGTLDAVVSDDRTQAIQENNTALHEL